jgi:hypothetical protein
LDQGSRKISLQISFQNLTQQPLVLKNQLRVSPASDISPYYDLFPEISLPNGDVLYYGITGDGPPQRSALPEDFIQINPQGVYGTTIEVPIPSHVLGNNVAVPLEAGMYYLQISYINGDIGPAPSPDSPDRYDWGAWVGKLESNQIQVCFQYP